MTKRAGNIISVATVALVVGIATLNLGHADTTAGKPEFQELFNGKDLTGWDGDENYWSVQDGVITGRSTAEKPLKRNTFLIWKGGTLKDFELRVSYKIAGGNSGVQFRSKDDGDHVVSGYQA